MIDYMIIAAPRSGTTWAANWLTTQTTLCLHDPLWHRTKEELDSIKTNKVLGISCTALALFPHWLNTHNARKVILHRSLQEIDESLISIGLTALSTEWNGALDKIAGYHCDWRDLFYKPQWIYEYLLELPFDAERHAELAKMDIQPDFERLKINPKVTANLVKQLRAAMH